MLAIQSLVMVYQTQSVDNRNINFEFLVEGCLVPLIVRVTLTARVARHKCFRVNCAYYRVYIRF